VTGKAEVSPTETTDYHNPGADGRRAQGLLKACLASSEGKAAAADLANFADGGAELYFFDVREV
jgi:hypothetical protein